MKELLKELFTSILSEAIDDAEITYVDSKGKKRTIQARTVATSGETHPAWPQYLALKQKGKIKNKQQTDKNLSGAVGGKKKGAAAPDDSAKGKAVSDAPPASAPFSELQKKAQRTVKELYGRGGSGPLLQESPSSDAALRYGYTEGSWWVAPGNAGSNFNENISNEGGCILAIQPDLTENELAMVLFERTRGTALAAQQKDSVIKSSAKIVIPKDLPKEDKELYKACVIAARSARSKYQRISAGMAATREAVGFGTKVTVTAVGGTSRKPDTPADVATDREKILSAIDSSRKCFVYDPETQQTYEIPKNVLTQWVKDSGGGENAADTVVFATDENGNLLYDGWSDKKSLADLQSNSSLNNDMSRATERTNDLLERGLITQKSATETRRLLETTQREITKVERGYKLVAGNNAEYFLGKSRKQITAIEAETAEDPTTSKHYRNFAVVVDNIKNGKGKTDAKSVAIAEVISGTPRVKSTEERQLEKDVTEQIEKYGAESYEEFLADQTIDEKIKAEVTTQKERLNKIAASGRKKYMESFNETLQSPLSPDAEFLSYLESVTPFEILCEIAKKDVEIISADDRKVLERAAIKERQRLVDAGEQVPKLLLAVERLSELRQIALNSQRRVFTELEKIPARTSSGRETTVGALLGFEDAKDALHLDKINLPEDKTDFKQILRRSTQLVLEGIAVTPQILRECLGVDNTQDLEEHFVVGFDNERFTTATDNPKIVTGKTVALYMVDKNGVRKEIAPKVFRSKSGLTGKTQNTLQWSDTMQKCFDSKRDGK